MNGIRRQIGAIGLAGRTVEHRLADDAARLARDARDEARDLERARRAERGRASRERRAAARAERGGRGGSGPARGARAQGHGLSNALNTLVGCIGTGRGAALDGRRLLVRIGACAVLAAAIAGVATALAPKPAVEQDTGPHHAQIAIADGQQVGIPATPQSQWRAGTLPYLYQTDAQWADAPYAGAKLEKSGCGPTCLSMVYIALTGKTDLNPAQMAAFSEQNGYVEEGMTAWRLMSDGAAQLGLSSEAIPVDADTVREALGEGKILIFSVNPGDFTKVGHFLVVSGLTDDGRLIIHDPNSARNSFLRWDIDRVLGQTANIWEFSAA